MKEYIINLLINNFGPVAVSTALGAVVGTGVFVRIILTLRHGAKLLDTFVEAVADDKLSKSEIMDMRAKIKDIFSIWKRTPKTKIEE